MLAGVFELVIFDCDGVLVDSEPSINRAHADVLTACGYPITERDLVERFCGMSDAEMLDVIEREWGRMLPPSYTERVGAMIELGFCHWLAAIEGVAEVIDCDRERLLSAQARRDRCLRGAGEPALVPIDERLGMTRDSAEDFDHPRFAEGRPLCRHGICRP
jgi:phosphoglycolate phosphatase-like HAD superfamily hydrolase